MHSVLLIITKVPKASGAEQQSWAKIQETIAEQASLYKDVKIPNGFLLEIPLESSMPAFVNVLHLLQTEQFSYQVLFFEEEPQWIHYSPQQ